MDIRDRLRAKIIEQDKQRGRRLTDHERLANLRAAIYRPVTIAECEAEMTAEGFIAPAAPIPFEPQPE